MNSHVPVLQLNLHNLQPRIVLKTLVNQEYFIIFFKFIFTLVYVKLCKNKRMSKKNGKFILRLLCLEIIQNLW